MINTSTLRRLCLLLGLCLLPLTACWAITLDEARGDGLVGERPDGYVGLIDSSPSAELKDLIESINRQRRDRYAEIARRNQQPRSVVERLAGLKVREELAPGSYYMDDQGQWRRK